MTERDQAIALKMDKARALMSEVEVQLKNHFYTTAINRLYYSCFHATKALLLTKDLTPKTHSGVVSMLHQHFVSDDSFDKTHAAFFSKLEEVKEFIEPAKKYIECIEKTIAALPPRH